MRVLALDLGTNTGWAIGVDGKLVDCGTWKLATDKEIALAGKNRMRRRLDPRIPALHDRLRNCWVDAENRNLDWVVWEDVQFSSTTMQTQLWSSFRTVVWLFADYFQLHTECLGVQKLKQFATGHGGATKEMMMRALARQRPEEFSLDTEGRLHYFAHGKDAFLSDDAADAVHILSWATKNLCRAT